jgi:hypothetical protein
MKTITRFHIYLPMSAMILTGAVAIAAASQQVTFKGTLQGSDAVSPGRIIGSRPMETPSIQQLPQSAETSDIPDLLKVTEVHTITGGTGRFTGTQGSFTVDRLHNTVPGADGTHVIFGSFHGTITSPGAAH